MAECTFYQIYKIMDTAMNRGRVNNQLDKVTCMYYSFLSVWESLDLGQISRWINGKQPLSPAIAEYYSQPSKRSAFPDELKKNLLPNLVDPEAVVKDLYDLIQQDDSLSWEKRESLTCHYKDGWEGWLERFMADVLYYVACRPAGPVKNATMKLASGRPSPDASERIRGAGPPLPVRHFTGREEELTDLHEMLVEDKIVFIHGIAGIGKSELARQYAKVHKKEYTNILHMTYSGDLRKDIRNLAFSDDQPEEDEDTRLERHQRYLRSLKGDTLLIIDNFDVLEEDESFFSELTTYSCRILLTSRYQWEDYAVLELDGFQEDKEILGMISALYPQGAYDPEGMKEMAASVENHTLTVELCSRLLARGVLSLDELLDKLKGNITVPDSTDRIRIRKDGKVSKQTYYEHIHLLFGLFRLSEGHRSLLANVAMIPVGGIDRRILVRLMKLQDANELNELIDMGLIHQGEDDRISLHPLIRALIYEEIKPDDRMCGKLCEGIREQCLRYAEDVEWRYELMDMILNIIRYMESKDVSLYMGFLEDVCPYMEKYNNTAGMDAVLAAMKETMNNTSGSKGKDTALYYDYLAAKEKDPGKRLNLQLKAIGYLEETNEITLQLLISTTICWWPLLIT